MTAISGTMTPEIAEALGAEATARLILLELDTTDGFVRLILADDGYFTDVNGIKWAGSKLLSMGDLTTSINGKAPEIELSFSYTLESGAFDMVSEAKKYGVAAVEGRDCRIAYQWLSGSEGFYKPLTAPFLLMKRKMRSLKYSFSGAQGRRLGLTIEGPTAMRSRPVSGRYTDADQRRRAGWADPSLEFMPNNAFDEQKLFGL